MLKAGWWRLNGQSLRHCLYSVVGLVDVDGLEWKLAQWWPCLHELETGRHALVAVEATD